MSGVPRTATTTDPALLQTLSEYSLQLMWHLRQDALKAFEPFGLRPLSALIIEILGRQQCHPKTLADLLDTVPPAISPLLSELTDRRLVVRIPDPADRRRTLLALTAEGEAMRRNLARAWWETAGGRLRHLSEQELRTLVAIYGKLLGGA